MTLPLPSVVLKDAAVCSRISLRRPLMYTVQRGMEISTLNNSNYRTPSKQTFSSIGSETLRYHPSYSRTTASHKRDATLEVEDVLELETGQ